LRAYPTDALIAAAKTDGSTLIVVGTHGLGRIAGIVGVSTATNRVHRAPCSVLVARPSDDGFPRHVVVGLDGSVESAWAFEAAERLASRFGTTIRPVVARRGKRLDLRVVAALTEQTFDELPGEPVEALVAASAGADLLIIGSRALHGLKALASVSERVAHRARCSTLIVRASASLQGRRRWEETP
jgi:nucleotide-binding universal stress UspA family protein